MNDYFNYLKFKSEYPVDENRSDFAFKMNFTKHASILNGY